MLSTQPHFKTSGLRSLDSCEDLRSRPPRLTSALVHPDWLPSGLREDLPLQDAGEALGQHGCCWPPFTLHTLALIPVLFIENDANSKAWLDFAYIRTTGSHREPE